MSSIKDIVNKIKSKELNCIELLDEHIPKIKTGQDKLNTFISLNLSRARMRAEELDTMIENGEDPGPLCGIPFAIKDNMMFENETTTCGSNMLKNYIAPYTATAVKKLESAGAVIVGKTNMDEFAMGSSGETSAFGTIKNPYDISRIPGGSSSGSAASVADYQVVASLGSDTGGSIRQPASLCGVVGLKPTYGLVSRYGLVAFASSLDQIGPFGRTVEDASIVLNVIAGYDPLDSTSIEINKEDYSRGLEDKLEGLKVGVPKEYMSDGLDDEVRVRIEEVIKNLEKNGARIKDVSFPLTKYAVATYYIVAPAEASANLARYDGVKYGYRTENPKNLLEEYTLSRNTGFGEEVKRRIMIGTYVLSSGYYEAYYVKAQKVRTLMKNDFERTFKEVDVIIGPTSPSTAFKIGEKSDDPLKMYLSDIYTISCNLVGIPGINIPVGFDSNSLPIGCQILGKNLSENMLFRVGRQIERIYDRKE